ncbi:hypothetical protein R3W88_022573 [Solanum pinnatisectum]|uniref:Rad51-like C-terminal domain-containing protein n=1 Tax=Solanum pinnatisectum TaxID=50273 RepID=A0AAV9LXZ2_9SOLN|nr:hypothetical protein R3W88_022573 [Solanum pinnatisectum]
MKMAEFKSEKLLQLVGCEEGWFESSDKLISHGINVEDVKKFQEAGIYTCNGLMMHIKKREAVVGNTTGSESLDDVLGGGKKDTSAITKLFGEVRLKQGMVFSLVLHLSAGKTSRRSSL